MAASTHPALTSLDDVCDAVFTLDGPALVGLAAGDRGYTLRDGPSFDRPEDLVGFRAPPSWDGLAVIVCGRAHHDDGGDTSRARVTFSLARDGSFAGSVTTPHGSTRLGTTEDRPLGHLADVCHRALGLAAAPELSNPNDLIAATWLGDLLAAADAMGSAFDLDDWPGMLSLHPLGGRTSDATWADIHEALVVVGSGWGRFTADEIAWMDAPTWARFVHAGAPQLSWLLEEISHRVSTSTMALVHTVVDRGADSVRGGREGGG